MKRSVVPCLGLAMLVGFSALRANRAGPNDPDARKQAIKKELRTLEGTWTMFSREARGINTPAEDLKAMQLKIKGDQWTLKHSRGRDKATIKIDPAKEPKAIDFDFTSLGAGGTTIRLAPGRKLLLHGIYKLAYTEGAGETLTVCRAGEARSARPKDFKATDNVSVLFVFKRENK